MHDDDALDAASPIRLRDGDRIGGYRLLRVLGEGGMGVVYLAEQTEPVRREVALKILKPGMDTRQVVARFEAERQALAVMEHPGIAKVFDAGATEAGRPFFVMERVDGVPITEYCDAQRLGVRARVRLFAQVCRAVQHAHQKGVIHRDLKPSNVLVTVRGRRAAVQGHRLRDRPGGRADGGRGRDAADAAGPVARHAGVHEPRAGGLGRPGHRHPLGHLLAGRAALRAARGRAAVRDRRTVGWALYAQAPGAGAARPSAALRGARAAEQARIAARATDPPALRRQLRGDLDWVVMRALEKDRDRRYETANGLAARPGAVPGERAGRRQPAQPRLPGPQVRAAPPGGRRVRRRAGRAAGRLRRAMGVQAERVARARDLAVVRQGQAEDLIGFMVGDLRAKLTPVGRLDILDEVGQRALAYFAAVPESELTAEELFRRSQALTQLGEVRLDQGNLTAAQQAFGDALTLAQGLSARDPENGEWQIGLGAAHFWVGYVHWLQGALEDALRQFNPYLDISRRMVQRDADNPQYQLELGYAWSNIGSVREAQGDLDGAVAAFRETLAVKRALVEQDPTNPEWQSSLANTLNTLGVALRKLGMLEAAEEQHRAEIEIKERLVRQDTLNLLTRRSVGTAHNFLGQVLQMQGRPEALNHFELHRQIIQGLHQRDPDNAEWRRELSTALRRHGAQLVQSGRAGEAMDRLSASRVLVDGLLETDSTSVEWVRERARVRLATAQALLSLGNSAAAEREAEAAAADTHRVLSSAAVVGDVLLAAEAELVRGLVLSGRGDTASAREGWTRALDRLAAGEPGMEDIHADALRATALLHLDRLEAAEAAVLALVSRGYRSTDLITLARDKGVLR
jgi:eukaryotic-like serine/threonine-protein kinase